MAEQVCGMKSAYFCLRCVGLEISDMYPGDMLLKNLNMIIEMHCKNLSFMGSQLIFLELIYAYMGSVIKIQATSDTFVLGCSNFFRQSFT